MTTIGKTMHPKSAFLSACVAILAVIGATVIATPPAQAQSYGHETYSDGYEWTQDPNYIPPDSPSPLNNTYASPLPPQGLNWNQRGTGNLYGTAWQRDGSNRWVGVGSRNRGQVCFTDYIGHIACE